MPMILLILDGLTDDPQPALGGKTPLAAAYCPNLHRMAECGAQGFFNTVPAGMPVDSLTCISTLLGVPPQSLPAGRAFLEALSCGAAVGETDAVCRCNLVSLNADGTLESSCAQGTEYRRQICEALARRLSTGGRKLTHMSSYKNLLVLAGGAEQVSGVHTFPPHQHAGEPFESLLPAGGALGEALAELARESKELLRAQRLALLPWGASVRQSLPAFSALHGMGGAAVCATEVVRGLALAMGLAVVTPEGATADFDTNLFAKARAALEQLGNSGFVLVHVNGTDELSHRRDARGKAEFIARIDSELVAPLLAGMPPNTALLVCCDHTTLCATGRHRGGPQPFVLYGGAARGCLGERAGADAISILKG